MLSLLNREFEFTDRTVAKGEGVEWSVDRRTISILMADWIRPSQIGHDESANRSDRVVFAPRQVGSDRIDLRRWSESAAAATVGKVDAHLPENCYRHKVWKILLPLIDALYNGANSKHSAWSRRYHSEFIQTFHHYRNDTDRR
jgi:hypothetical protein